MFKDKALSRKIILTQDGSHSIYVPQLQETYHSTHGARQEAEHIFIKEALSIAAQQKQSLNVLEIGFGTGLNAYLSMQYALKHSLRINYYGIEKYPVSKEEIGLLNYHQDIVENKSYFQKLHQSQWGSSELIAGEFYLEKMQVDFREMKLANQYFDVVYFDAFGPDVQPELWSAAIFQMIHQSMKSGGIMTTYSVKGDVRRAMKSVGFEVSKIPGPPGKREITRAIKIV